MERWHGKVAIVTGASVGIGPNLIKILSEKGMKVVGLSRLPHRLQDLAPDVISLKCDITSHYDVSRTFNHVTEKIGPVHVLINNAGLSMNTTLISGNTKEWRRVFDVNVMALCFCTKEAIKIMKGFDISGHIIHMNSIMGHKVPHMAEQLNVYPASKFAVTALTESLRQELIVTGSSIKVTSISPGLVKDDVTEYPSLKSNDVCEAIIYVLSTPPHVQVQELILRPVGELI